MLLVTIIIGTVFLLELLYCFIPIQFFRFQRTKMLRLKITHKGGVKEKLRIRIQNGENRKYQIATESNAYLKQNGKNLFLYSPYQQKLYANKRYSLENGTTMQVQRQKPRFLLTILLVIAFLMTVIFSEAYIQHTTVPAFAASTYPVVLTHDYAEYIDTEAYAGIENFLIVGSDAREGMMTPHADVMLLVSFNTNTKTIKLFSLSRDFLVSMQDKSIPSIDDLDPSLPNYEALKKSAGTQWFKAKLNAALTLQYIDESEHTTEEFYAQGLNNLVNCIEWNFKMPIQGIINFSWEDFCKTIDALGGVDIEITKEMLITKFQTDESTGEVIAYGIIPVMDDLNRLFGTDDHFKETPGVQHLNGNKALAYIRLRHIWNSLNSDLERAERIRNFVLQLISQKKSDLFSIIQKDKISEIADGIYTSLTEEELHSLVKEIYRFPSIENGGLLIKEFHDEIIHDTQYLIVDGKNEPILEEQAKEALCE